MTSISLTHRFIGVNCTKGEVRKLFQQLPTHRTIQSQKGGHACPFILTMMAISHLVSIVAEGMKPLKRFHDHSLFIVTSPK